MPSELEARLLADWNLETLEAYGAELRAAGDPRGELIAIDLVLETKPSRSVRDALYEEKVALQIAWFGEVGENIVTQFGFVEEFRDEIEVFFTMIDALAPFARKLDLWGDPPEVRQLATRMAAAPRPWLGFLEVRNFNEQTEPTIDNALARRLIDATPNLRTLKADGHLVFDDVPHPSVVHLIAQGHDSIGALRGDRVMPNVMALDFTLHPDHYIHREPPPHALRGGLVHRRAFPMLETLDVSRNEPRASTMKPNCIAGKTPIFEVLPFVEILPHVTTLRVPSLRNMTQAQQLQATLARMPQLRTLEIARTYTALLGAPTHPTAHITIAPRMPWPPADALHDYDALLFLVEEAWVRVDLSHAYEHCETHYATMPHRQQLAWEALWRAAHELRDDEARIDQFPMQTLSTLFETIATKEHHWWNELAKQLDDFAEPTISMRRIDGFEHDDDEEAAEPRTVASSERILEHERALQADWDLDRLAVYADDLLELGDERGALISVDLRLLREPGADVDIERDDLHNKIFGDAYEVRSKFGLSILDVTSWSDDEIEKFEELFTGERETYLSELELGGPYENVDADLKRVFVAPRPWLRVVRIETLGAPGDEDDEAETDEAEIDWAEVAASWPHLEEFELGIDRNTPMFAGFVHDNVRRLRMTGFRAFERLGAPWPSVVELDIALGRHYDDPSDLDPTVFSRARLPAVRSVDFSRNERRSGSLDRDSRHQGHHGFFELFARLDDDFVAQLVRVRLPSPRTVEDVRAIQATLDRMTALETLEIVRRYPKGPDVTLAHPTAKLVIPAPSPWLPLDLVPDRSALSIQNVKMPIADAVLAMEQNYDAMPDAAKDAWRSLWTFIADEETPTLRIAASKVYTAMDAQVERDRYMYGWAEKTTAALHSLALAEQTVTILRTED